jgi:hypothetical protein
MVKKTFISNQQKLPKHIYNFKIKLRISRQVQWKLRIQSSPFLSQATELYDMLLGWWESDQAKFN